MSAQVGFLHHAAVLCGVDGDRVALQFAERRVADADAVALKDSIIAVSASGR